MKKIVCLLIAATMAISVSAQVKDQKLQQALDEVKVQFQEFDTERLLDSLDQEKLPKLVSGGLFGGGNVSNFIITRNHVPMSSYMRIGAELGGFLDFAITKHFAIQPQVILTAQQNYFAATDTTNRLWSFGVDIPIYFLGRFGNMEKGYIQFGGGVFSHFTFASNVQDKYQNVDKTQSSGTSSPAPRHIALEDPYDYSRLYSLHNNHFGVCVMVGYECAFGMIINAQYKVSLSDIAGFYTEMKGNPVADALIYPQSISLHIGYRWK
ncbi:MAG: outer membrane beta-barrel protein [Paludibacteraceae bacterium]|nr:outer membrane beta-barrel protein [Paludibacteraceae bacterium]